MPASMKFGIDWLEIRRRYEAGEKSSTTVDVSRQAIEKRATKEGWNRAKAASAPPIATASRESARQPIAANESPRAPKPPTAAIAIPVRSPQNAQAITDGVLKGASPELAARSVGITKD